MQQGRKTCYKVSQTSSVINRSANQLEHWLCNSVPSLGWAHQHQLQCQGPGCHRDGHGLTTAEAKLGGCCCCVLYIINIRNIIIIVDPHNFGENLRILYSMSLCKPLANYVFWKILIRFSNKLNKKLNILFPKLQY